MIPSGYGSARRGWRRHGLVNAAPCIPMSVLGQKQTFAVQKVMSALPPIATLIAHFGVSAMGQKRIFRSAIAMSALPL